jgi:mRNA interferase MazF
VPGECAASKPPLSSNIAIPSSENFTGYVVCDDITEIWEDEVLAVVGGFKPATMQAVSRGLAAALGMD